MEIAFQFRSFFQSLPIGKNKKKHNVYVIDYGNYDPAPIDVIKRYENNRPFVLIILNSFRVEHYGDNSLYDKLDHYLLNHLVEWKTVMFFEIENNRVSRVRGENPNFTPILE